MANHWNDSGDLVIEEKTLFHQVGWLGTSGRFYPQGTAMPGQGCPPEPGGYAPVYQQIATWVEGEGWKD